MSYRKDITLNFDLYGQLLCELAAFKDSIRNQPHNLKAWELKEVVNNIYIGNVSKQRAEYIRVHVRQHAQFILEFIEKYGVQRSITRDSKFETHYDLGTFASMMFHGMQEACCFLDALSHTPTSPSHMPLTADKHTVLGLNTSSNYRKETEARKHEVEEQRRREEEEVRKHKEQNDKKRIQEEIGKEELEFRKVLRNEQVRTGKEKKQRKRRNEDERNGEDENIKNHEDQGVREKKLRKIRRNELELLLGG